MPEKIQLNRQKQRRADWALVFVALIWGGSFLSGDLAIASFSPFFILTCRYLISAVLMAPFCRKRLRELSGRAVRLGIGLGLLQVIMMTAQLTALNYTTPGKQAFLVATYPIFVPFLSWAATKQRPGPKVLLAAVLMIVGIGFLSLNETLSLGVGDLLSLLFALLFGLQFVLIGMFAASLDPIALSFVQFLTAGLCSLTLTAATGQWPAGCSVGAAGSVAYLVVVNLLFIVQYMAQKYTTDTRASILTSLQCLFGFLLSALLMHEPVTPKVVLGCALIFSAVILSNLAGRESAE